MNVLRITRWCTLTALVALGTTIGLNQHIAAAQPAASAAGQDGVEVLTRGPVHEAFAETITFDPEPGIVAPKAPPAAIEEVPPQQRPAGKNVTWIPGYWGWDDERNDFLWLSGIWRALPPGRQWVPGYWGQSRQGSQWTSGYWADAAASEIDYLPEPPATVEAGPNIAAPSADDIWLPGCWVWQQNRYAWRPGYWTQGNQDWDWVPDHYVWTPSGYVFVDGYYDYSVPRRGIVFAPVYFNGGLRTQRGFSYSPSTVINPGVFVSHLFLRPGYGHYYFGDYYGSNYADAGFSPWFSYQSSRRGYDPIYANQRWQHRQDRDWEQRTEANFRNLRDNENARPPRTWAAQRELAGRGETSNRRNIAVAAPLDELAQRKDSRLRFQPVDPAGATTVWPAWARVPQVPPAAATVGSQCGAHARRRSCHRSRAGTTGASHDLPSWRRPPISLARTTLRHSDTRFSSRTSRFSPNRERVAANREHVRAIGKGQRAAAAAAAAGSQSRRIVARPAAASGVNQGNRQGASAGQSQGQGANRGQSQGASNNQSQDAPRNQSSGESKKKDKD